jgi:hypothetical protein
MILFAVSCLLFGTWFVLSVVKQFRPIPARTFWLENFTFIPRWWFFKYNFEEGEFRVSVRAVDSEWVVIELPRPPFWRQWIWNPEMRVDKVLWDACSRVCALPEWLRFSKNFSPSTVAFKVLVAWVVASPQFPAAPDDAIQLMVERVPLTPGAGEAVAWFVSRPFVPQVRDAEQAAVPVG